MTATRTYGVDPPWMGSTPVWTGSSWRCTLRYQGRSMTIPFFLGEAIGETPPSVKDLLECLQADARTVESCPTQGAWREEFGLPDTRETEQTWKAVTRQTDRLRRLLGDAYSDWLEADLDEEVEW